MSETYEQSDESEMILGIAEALREEFGDGIDAHPGGVAIEAGQVNRAFRVMARHFLKPVLPPGGDLPNLVTWILRRAALRRLEADLEGSRTERLVAMEPVLGDAWLIYLALAPRAVIRDLLDAGTSEAGR